jgi:hypothetical protein
MNAIRTLHVAVRQKLAARTALAFWYDHLRARLHADDAAVGRTGKPPSYKFMLAKDLGGLPILYI